MPTVFLSYSRADLPLIEQLKAQLKSHSEIVIWRDQEKIYGGQKWPKVLGEAIARQDVPGKLYRAAFLKLRHFVQP
ncbi:MAG: toll/interleukin-1 receptor domain-containing protein [Nitrospira sp.]